MNSFTPRRQAAPVRARRLFSSATAQVSTSSASSSASAQMRTPLVSASATAQVGTFSASSSPPPFTAKSSAQVGSTFSASSSAQMRTPLSSASATAQVGTSSASALPFAAKYSASPRPPLSSASATAQVGTTSPSIKCIPCHGTGVFKVGRITWYGGYREVGRIGHLCKKCMGSGQISRISPLKASAQKTSCSASAASLLENSTSREASFDVRKLFSGLALVRMFLLVAVFMSCLPSVQTTVTKPQMTLFCNLAVTAGLASTVSECYLRLNKETPNSLCLNVDMNESDPLGHTCVILSDMEALLKKFSSALFTTGIESVLESKECPETSPSECPEIKCEEAIHSPSECPEATCSPTECPKSEAKTECPKCECPEAKSDCPKSKTTCPECDQCEPCKAPTSAPTTTRTTTTSTRAATAAPCVCLCEPSTSAIRAATKEDDSQGTDSFYGFVQCEDLKRLVLGLMPFFLHWLNCTLTTLIVYFFSCKGRCTKPNYLVLTTLGLWGYAIHRLYVFHQTRRIARDALADAQRMNALQDLAPDARDGGQIELGQLPQRSAIMQDVPL